MNAAVGADVMCSVPQAHWRPFQDALLMAGLVVREVPAGPNSRGRFVSVFERDGDGPYLSEREVSVLRLIAQGCTNAEIGRRMLLSEDTVKSVATRLYGKLGARDRAHAVAIAFARGILTARGAL